MLEGKELILATKPFAREDRAKSWKYTFSTLLVLAVLYTGIFAPTPAIVKAVCCLLVGLTLVRMFIIYHDYLHKAILQRSFLADIIFTLFGFYILAPKSIWTRSHDYHHQHNSKLYSSSIGSFPTVTREKFLSMSGKERLIYLFIRHPLTISMGYIFAFLYGMCIRSLLRSPNKHWYCGVGMIYHYGIAYAIYYLFGTQAFVFGFLIPAFMSGAIGSYLFYAQHNFPGARFESKEGWTYIKAALQSSSYMEMSPILRWFTGNIGYHHIHHTNSRIPFYRLPEVYAKFPEFQKVGKTTLLPLDIIRCLRLKVWDPAQEKMIGLAGIKKTIS